MTDNPKTTKAPWYVIMHPGDTWTIQNREEGCGDCVAASYGDSSLANAHLIAAAPDLLQACKLAVAAMGNMDAARHIQSVIDKAEGRQMSDPKTTAPARGEQRIEITPHIRVLWGADVDVDGEQWTGWAIWDDRSPDDEIPVFRTKDEAVTEAKRIAKEYRDGAR